MTTNEEAADKAASLLAGSRLSLQAQPSGGAADSEDISERPALDVVAGGAIVVPAS